MGYYSDVGLCLTATGKKVLDAGLTALEPHAERTKNIHELLNSSRDKREADGAVAWLWYNGFYLCMNRIIVWGCFSMLAAIPELLAAH